MIAVALREPDSAVALLGRAFALSSNWRLNVNHPGIAPFDSLRTHPGFRRLMETPNEGREATATKVRTEAVPLHGFGPVFRRAMSASPSRFQASSEKRADYHAILVFGLTP